MNSPNACAAAVEPGHASLPPPPRETHNTVTGAPLPPDDAALMRSVQGLSNLANELVTAIAQRNHDAMPGVIDGPAAERQERGAHRSNEALFEARRALQVGLMWTRRAIANPEGF